jgi:hypothetical protein
MNPENTWGYYKYICEMDGSKPTIREYLFGHLLYEPLMRFHRTSTCKIFDHKWHETTPYNDAVEYGAVDLECQRCGYSLDRRYW